MVKFDLFNYTDATGGVNLVSSAQANDVNPEGYDFLSSALQTGCSVFCIYICLDAAVSLKIVRTKTSTAQTVTETLAAETVNQPNWHTIAVSAFETIQLQLSGPATILTLKVMEPHPTV